MAFGSWLIGCSHFLGFSHVFLVNLFLQESHLLGKSGITLTQGFCQLHQFILSPNNVGTDISFGDPWQNDDSTELLRSKLYYFNRI